MTTTTTTSPHPHSPGIGIPAFARTLLAQREWGVALLLALTITVVAIVNPNFLHLANLRDVLVNNAPFAIIACGVTFVVVTGEIDISVGSVAGLLSAVMGLLTSRDHAHMNVALACAIVAAIGTFVGAINGFLVAYLNVPSIIVTLGMLTALRGATELLMAGKWIQNLPDSLRFLGTGSLAGIPISILTAAAVIFLCMILATRTPLGRRIYAVGSNVHAARLAGLSPRRIKLFVFTFTGFLVAVATLVGVTKFSTIDPAIGKTWELFVVTAVVVGGTSISGGKGTIIGTLLGVLLLGIVGTVLTFLKLGDRLTYWERAIQGAFILLAVLADHLGGKRTGSGEGH